jgi:hypothetical protein
MADLDELLKASQGAPLGPVRVLLNAHFIYALPWMRQHRYIMPWCLINSISSTLTQYTTYNPPADVFVPGYAAMALFDSCSGLTILRLDIWVNQNTWDFGHFGGLASFSKLENLVLHVHQLPENNTMTAQLDGGRQTDELFEEAVMRLLALRLTIPGCGVLYVAFKEIRSFDENDVTSIATDSDITFFMDDKGNIRSMTMNGRGTSLRERYAMYSTEELRQKVQKCHTMITGLPGTRAQALCELESDITEELIHRERLERIYRNSFMTLYDQWLAEEEKRKAHQDLTEKSACCYREEKLGNICYDDRMGYEEGIAVDEGYHTENVEG